MSFESFDDFMSTGNEVTEKSVGSKEKPTGELDDDWGVLPDDEENESKESKKGLEDSDEEEGEGEEEGEKVSKDSQLNTLKQKNAEEEKAKGSKKDNKAANRSDEEDEDESKDGEESKDSSGDAEGESEGETKKIRLFKDNKAYEIPEDGELKVKIDGKWKKVPITELRDNYSGKVAYEEKFEKLSEERKSFESEYNERVQEIAEIRDELTTIADLTTKAMSGEGDVFAPFMYLLDIMGGDSLAYNRLMMDTLGEQSINYYDMTDEEKQSYWNSKELASIKNRQESESQRASAGKAQEETVARIREVREAQGVSEEDYSFAEKELKAIGTENITPEMVVQTVKISDNMNTVTDLLEPYRDQLDDEEANDVINELALSMYKVPSITPEMIKQKFAETYEVEDIVDVLSSKHLDSESVSDSGKKKMETVYDFESFDDF